MSDMVKENIESIDGMRSVPFEGFLPGVNVPVDIYVRLTSGKFVLVMRAGDSFQSDRLEAYQTRNLEELFVLQKDYPAFVQREVSVAGVLIKISDISNSAKTNVLKKTARMVFDEIENMGLSKETYKNAKKVTSSVVTVVNSNLELKALLESLGSISDDLLRQSFAVGFIAPMIGQAMKWTRPDTLEKLALGGFLHDIGKKELPPEILTKPRTSMSYNEVKEYESHPFRGVQMIANIRIVPDDIAEIIYQHHENAIGQGYPRRLWDRNINPLARVVALANVFCELTLKSPLRPKPRSVVEAVEYIETIMGQPFNKEAFAGLKKIISMNGLAEM